MPENKLEGNNNERYATTFMREALGELSIGRVWKAKAILEHALAMAQKAKKTSRGAA